MTNSPKNIFRDLAPSYWKSGFSAIPVRPGTKKPTISGWSGFNVNLPGEKNRHKWMEDFPDAGIGLCLGTKLPDGTRLAAIDIDDERLVNFVKAVLGKFPCAKVGAKGLTIFVRAVEGIKSAKVSPRGSKPRVEFFITTGQVVLPPTIHPDTGDSYKWVGTELLDTELPSLPLLSIELFDLISAVVRNEHSETILNGEGTHDAMLCLTALGLHKYASNEFLTSVLTALLPKGYSGNSLEELPGMLESAEVKGLGSGPVSEYQAGEFGPIPLGYLPDGQFALRDNHMNRISGYPSQALATEGLLLGLAPKNFWLTQFPRRNMRGEITGIDSKGAANALIEACRKQGPFDTSRVHGRGVWREGNRIVVNLGGEIPDDLGDHYVCFSPLPKLVKKVIHGGDVHDFLNLFNWRRDGDATLLLGWLTIAPICGALDWRPHLFVTGAKNTGKTTLVRAVRNLLDPLVVVLDGQSTEAGIRQKLGPDSLPVVLDEFESDGRLSRMTNVLRLARSASSAEGSVARGTPEGRAFEFNIRTTFLFAAINPIRGTSADSSRIVAIDLEPHEGEKKTQSDIELGLSWLDETKGAWSHQAIDILPMVLETLRLILRQMPSMDSRHAQNMATCLAGAWVALEGRVPNVDEANTWIGRHQAIVEHHAEAHSEDDSMSCLNYLLGAEARGQTIGDLIQQVWSYSASNVLDIDPALELGTFGVRVEVDEKSNMSGVYIANKHPGLDKIFGGTTWAAGSWKSALQRLDGVEKPENPVRIGGVKIRVIKLPTRYFPHREDPEEEMS
jgi:hypothetical protein